MKRRNFAGLIGLMAVPSVGVSANRDRMVMMNLGDAPKERSLSVMMRIENNLSGKLNHYRVRLDTVSNPEDEDINQFAELASLCLKKSVKDMTGVGEFSCNYPNPCTYEEAEREYRRKHKI